MIFYLAPMEGLTGYVFRNIVNRRFPGITKYYSPFISPDGSGKFKAGSMRDIQPENNRDLELVPQVLCNAPEQFIGAAKLFGEMGYSEVNLNAGCPSGTVVPKHKGAGMLGDIQWLDNFLEEIFSHTELKISVKTRLGVDDSEHFPQILEVYNKYPIHELTVHARNRAGQYKSPVDLQAFKYATEHSKNPVCYNGNIFSAAELNKLTETAPCEKVMVGRGVCANPALVRQFNGGNGLEKAELRDFLDELTDGLLASGLSEHFALARIKELWYYMQDMFPGGEKNIKQLKRSKYISDYNSALDALFAENYFNPNAKFRG